MTNYTFSKTPTINFNTTPASIARSATGSVYAVGDTGFTTPLNMTMVIGGAVVTTISSDALGLLPDFTLWAVLGPRLALPRTAQPGFRRSSLAGA